jgi:hypothetical protein
MGDDGRSWPLGDRRRGRDHLCSLAVERRLALTSAPAAFGSERKRADVPHVVDQVLDMVAAIATIRGTARYVEPILQTALDGLRP